MKQSEINEMARLARENGLCVSCGNLTDRDKTGTYFVKCAKCRAGREHSARSAANLGQQKKILVPDYCYFDEPEFKAFCQAVAKLLPKGETFTISEMIKSAIDGGVNEEMVRKDVGNAIWWLEDEHIECVKDTTPKRYKRLAQPRRKADEGYNTSISIKPNGERRKRVGITI